MKKSTIVMVFLLSLLVVFGVVTYLFWEIGQNDLPQGTTVSGQQDENLEEGLTMEDLLQFYTVYEEYSVLVQEFLNGFMDVTYNCDYSKRNYFDGAEAYMTEKCYGYYVPLMEPDEGGQEEMTESDIAYISYLKGTNYFFSFSGPTQVDCLAVVSYSSSVGMLESQTDRLLLTVTGIGDDMKISSIEIVD